MIPPQGFMGSSDIRGQKAEEKKKGSKNEEGSGAQKENMRRIGLGGCLPKTQTILAIQIKSDKIGEKVEMWKEKYLIKKFVVV